MKTIQKVIIFLLPYIEFCQFTTPEIYGEYNLFVDEEFDSNVYHKITFDTQLTSFKCIVPEVDVSYYFGIHTEDR